jgi:solute carrier family 25 folate transporter 32
MKGARVAVVTVPIFYSMYFPLYEHLKRFYSQKIYGNPKSFNWVVYSLSASTAGFLCDLITNPMWVVRIRYQTEFLHTGNQSMDSFNVFKLIKQLYEKVIKYI